MNKLLKIPFADIPYDDTLFTKMDIYIIFESYYKIHISRTITIIMTTKEAYHLLVFPTSLLRRVFPIIYESIEC